MTRVLALVHGGGALPCALGLGEVTALVLGDPDGARGVAAAMAAGVARVVAIAEDGIVATDYLGAAQVVASAARKLGFDVIVAGAGHRGALGPAVAERLSLLHLTGVVEARIDDQAVIARRRAGGFVRTYRAPLPVVLCASAALALEAPPASPSVETPIERLTLAEIGVAPAELGWRRRFAPQPATGPTPRPRVLPDVPALVERLRAERLVGGR